MLDQLRHQFAPFAQGPTPLVALFLQAHGWPHEQHAGLRCLRRDDVMSLDERRELHPRIVEAGTRDSSLPLMARVAARRGVGVFVADVA
jgi:hypothetical protein